MSTINSGFVVTQKACLQGTAFTAAPAVLAMSNEAAETVNAAEEASPGNAGALRIDAVSINLATAGFAKNAGVFLTLSGTTAITLDLTALAAATGVVFAGDTSFAAWNQIVLTNSGTKDVSVSPGGSNPARLLLTGTGPAITVPASSVVTLASLAGLTVDSTHKTITVTPTTGGNLGIAIGGV